MVSNLPDSTGVTLRASHPIIMPVNCWFATTRPQERDLTTSLCLTSLSSQFHACLLWNVALIASEFLGPGGENTIHVAVSVPTRVHQVRTLPRAWNHCIPSAWKEPWERGS